MTYIPDWTEREGQDREERRCICGADLPEGEKICADCWYDDKIIVLEMQRDLCSQKKKDG
jgi:hypothetical protein